MDQSGIWANTTIGVLAARPLRSARTQASCSAPRVPRPPGFELEHVDQPDEVHAGVIEAVIALVAGCAAESIEISVTAASAVSCSPGTVCISVVRSLENSCCARSNSAAFDKWVMSPYE